MHQLGRSPGAGALPYPDRLIFQLEDARDENAQLRKEIGGRADGTLVRQLRAQLAEMTADRNRQRDEKLRVQDQVRGFAARLEEVRLSATSAQTDQIIELREENRDLRFDAALARDAYQKLLVTYTKVIRKVNPAATSDETPPLPGALDRTESEAESTEEDASGGYDPSGKGKGEETAEQAQLRASIEAARQQLSVVERGLAGAENSLEAAQQILGQEDETAAAMAFLDAIKGGPETEESKRRLDYRNADKQSRAVIWEDAMREMEQTIMDGNELRGAVDQAQMELAAWRDALTAQQRTVADLEEKFIVAGGGK